MNARRSFSLALHFLVLISITLLTIASTPHGGDNSMTMVTAEYGPDESFPFSTQTSDFTIALFPSISSVCSPGDANFTVDIDQIQGFSDLVTLFTSKQPAGTTASFGTNPVSPPGSSSLTIGNIGVISAGVYQIEVTGLAPTSTHMATADLIVYTNSPVMPGLLAPSNAESDVSLTPEFTWSLSDQGDVYNLEVALDSNFSNIVIAQTGLQVTNYTAQTELNSDTTYFWRVSSGNSCGTGSFSNVFQFTTLSSNSVFLPLVLR